MEFLINKLCEISDKQFDEKENKVKSSLEDFEVQDINPEESEVMNDFTKFLMKWFTKFPIYNFTN